MKAKTVSQKAAIRRSTKGTNRVNKRKEDRNALIARVIAAKDKLPVSGVSSFFLAAFPEFNTNKGKSKLNNVLQFRTSDAKITDCLEQLASKMSTPV